MARIALSMLSRTGASPITRYDRASQMPQILTRTRSKITLQCRSGVSTEDFDLKEYTKPLIESVNRELDKLIPVSDDKVEEAMRYAVMGGGKRSCPVMCIAASEAVGGHKEEALLVACAMEMIHTASLILDDLPCMDDDSLRHGRPSTHIVFGQDAAIRASDALCALAFHHIARPSHDALAAQRALRVVYELAKAGGSTGMVGGQYVDLASAGSSSIEPALVEYIYRHKSALMAEISVVGGGIAGGGSDEEVERLRNYGRSVGLAYQIVDDMLDLSATTEELGKTAGKDNRAGKATYPEIYGMEKCREIVLDLAHKAQGCISQFDPLRAAPLVGFAQFVISKNF